MRDHVPDPEPRAAALLGRSLGPFMLLALLIAWGAALLMPSRDAARFETERRAGLEALPTPPAPDRSPGIDGRPLDPDSPTQPGPGGTPDQQLHHGPQPAHPPGAPPSGKGPAHTPGHVRPGRHP